MIEDPDQIIEDYKARKKAYISAVRSKAGRIGGKQSYLKGNSEKAREMAQIRWRKYRENNK